MANKKIKHIIAKLVGSSTEETMDVYDVDAVHTSDVINNLTSNTDAAKTKPLSAYQGYVLNNNFTNKIKGVYSIQAATYQNTTAKAWEYIGASFTVPSNHVYLANLHNNYEGARPIGLGFNAGTDLAGGVPAIAYGNGEETIYDTPVCMLLPGTWYIFTKRLAIASKPSTYQLRYFDITL